MRIDRLWIDDFKNLKNIEIDFNNKCLTTVIIGENGTGKSHLIEAIAFIFRNFDLDEPPPPFNFELDYHIDENSVRIWGKGNEWGLIVNDEQISRPAFKRRKDELLPELVFGYYSGGNRWLESLFDTHQANYYRWVKSDQAEKLDAASPDERRLFYCRPIHGVMALLSFFAFPDKKVSELLVKALGITDFHSAMVLFREPWYAKSKRERKVPSLFWGASGRPRLCAQLLRKVAFFPLARTKRILDDYRDKGIQEQQYCIYLRNKKSLQTFAENFDNDLQMFEALESVDISDLIRWVQVWVTRKDDMTGEISFGDLSDGERQLLMVLGLIRLSRGKRTLFLLDEPDTHLNPAWQRSYLDLIRTWLQADAKHCQLILTSHNPLTISALLKDEVRVMYFDNQGLVKAKEPYIDPRGLGFTSVLTEIFGLSTSLDSDTQKMVDTRNRLVRMNHRSKNQDLQLISINDTLNRLGFMFEDREPLYQDFLHAWQDVRYANRPPLSPEQIETRHKTMQSLIKRLLATKESNA